MRRCYSSTTVVEYTVMKKELNGRELAGFVKERQAKAVRGLRQQWKVQPKLAIIRTNPDPVVDSYMRIKQGYGEDIEVDVDVHTIDQSEALERIESEIENSLEKTKFIEFVKTSTRGITR